MIAIENIRLYTGEAYFEKGLVLVDKDRIAYAGAAGLAQVPEGAERVDGRGDVCMSGFYNAHCHAAMTLLRGVGSDLNLMDWLNIVMPIEDAMIAQKQAHILSGAMLAIMEMIRRGVVAFADMYFCMDEVARAAIQTGIRLNLSRGCTDKPALDSVDALYRDFHDAADGRVKVFVGLHGEYTSTPEVVEYAAEKARALNTGVHVHVAETAAEVAGCVQRHRVTPVRYFYDHKLFDNKTLAAHCVHVTEEDIELLLVKNVFVAHNPASNLKLASGVAPVSKMIDRGIHVALGTDGASSNNSLDMLSDMRLASYMQKGFLADPTLMNVKRSVNMATREGALAMDYPDAGILKAGMKADLILIDANAEHMTPMVDAMANVVYAAQGRDVKMTMVDGKVLYRDGEFTTLDPEEVVRKANESARRVGLMR